MYVDEINEGCTIQISPHSKTHLPELERMVEGIVWLEELFNRKAEDVMFLNGKNTKYWK